VNGRRCVADSNLHSFKRESWLTWDQISIGIYNTKGVAAGSVRKGIDYILRIVVPQAGLHEAVSQVAHVAQFSSATPQPMLELKVAMNVCQWITTELTNR
jgi:hypothetical protein